MKTTTACVLVAGAFIAMGGFGCGGPPPPPTKFAGKNRPEDIVLLTAARDLNCPIEELKVVAQSNRRHINESNFRYVVEGCGERAGYFESCEFITDPLPPGWSNTSDSPLACRNLLMTRVRIPTTNPPAPAPPPPPPPTPTAPPPQLR